VHHHSRESGLKRAFALTLAVLLVELVGGLLSHSLALLSDAGHVLTDVFALGLAASGYVSKRILEANAQEEVTRNAELMMGAALAVRGYTSKQVKPQLELQLMRVFLPQSVPAYAATEMFGTLRQQHPEYTYKEATLNPTNPRDRAMDWESDIIQRFRNDSQTQQVVGMRDTPVGKTLYLARPIHAKPECLVCHSEPAAAPHSLIARYGADNGFGWQPDEIVAAQVVSVPFASAQANANREFRAFMTLLVAVFAAAFLVVNMLLYRLVVRPVRHIAQVADKVSLGDTSAAEFPQHGAAEIVSVAHSFDRMRKSLEKALHMLGA